MPAHEDLLRRVPALLRRARSLLGLQGGPDGRLGPAEVSRAAAAVAKLHEGLVGDRALARTATYDDREHLGAYLLWWWPQSYAKVRAAWDLARLGSAGPLRILDVGAGAGPAALALLDAAGGEATAVDASAMALAEASALAAGAHLRTVRGDLARGLPRELAITEVPPGDSSRHGWRADVRGSTALESRKTSAAAGNDRFDVVVAANVLSELAEPERDALLDALPLARGGVALFVEPALRETGRALLAFRDRALARGFRALAPCLTQKPCPALASARDWCTAARRWEPPPHVVQIADATGLRADEELSYAPLALARDGGTAFAGPDVERDRADSRSDLWRVVGLAPPEKGKKRLWVCNDSGRTPLVRLDRHRGAANAALDELERGDLVRVSNADRRGDGLRVGIASRVERA